MKKDSSISLDILKLRLRGRGSGFKEGLENKGTLYSKFLY